MLKIWKFVKIFFNSQFIEYILAELRLIRQEIGFLREENQKETELQQTPSSGGTVQFPKVLVFLRNGEMIYKAIKSWTCEVEAK